MYMYVFHGPRTRPNVRIILQTVWWVSESSQPFLDFDE